MSEMINIQDDICWRCGGEFDKDDPELQRTTHHVLPQQLKPFKNVIVPIHRKCHDEITAHDISSLNAFAYRLLKSTEDLKGNVNNLTNLLCNRELFQLKVKKNEKKGNDNIPKDGQT